MSAETTATHRLAPAWRAWVLEQLAHGHPHAALQTALVGHGVPPDLAAEALVELAQAARLALPARLRLALSRSAPIAERPTLGPDFFAEHWEQNRPVVVRGYASAWPAFARWSPEALAARFPDALVEVEIERDPARNNEGRWVERRLAEVLADLDRPGNDRYCIARNENLRRPELRPLLDDVVIDEALFDASRVLGGSSLWIGPAGTLTPLHYDTTNILFTQVFGHKRFWLAPPDCAGLHLRLDGFYVRDDLEAVPEHALRVVDLAPGDALFLPVGWFHRVLALTPSISFSLLCFRRPNDFSWYR